MNRHIKTFGLALALSSFAVGQPWRDTPIESINAVTTDPLDSAPSIGHAQQEQRSDTTTDEKHLSKKEKKELKKRRKEEEKLRKKEAKEEEKRLHEQQKRQAKEDAKQQKRELKKEDKEIAKERKAEDKRERKEQAKEINSAEKHERQDERVIANSVSPAKGERFTIPVSYVVTPGLLQAQRNISRSIYSQFPGSHVIVLLNSANQVVLRGSAPNPSFKRRLLGLAMSAAGGYGIVDQLAANVMSNAASGVTSAAIGGISDLIHGGNSHQNDAGAGYNQQAPPPPYNAQAAYGSSPSSSSDYGPPPADNSSAMSGSPRYNSSNAYGAPVPGNGSPSSPGFTPGSNACVNINVHQTSITGQVGSPNDRDRLQQFAQELAGTNATVLNQLATRTTTETENATSSHVSETILDANALTSLVSPGSVICVSTDGSNATLLTGTVGSSAELAIAERTLQPLIGNARLIDQLTTGTLAGSAQATQSASVPPNAPAGITENEVEQALHSIPQLSNVEAQVSATDVHLSGSVATSEDEQVAREIAQQYAPGHSVIANLAIAPRE